MDTQIYNTKIEVLLQPVWHKDPPRVRVGINDTLEIIELRQEQLFVFDTDCQSGKLKLSVELLNKTDGDTLPDQGVDKAVVIKSLSINNIEHQKFVWQGQYQPQYPEPWYSEQSTKPNNILTGQTYLGWNGTWSLEITVPAFVWIHQTLDLGWIYN